MFDEIGTAHLFNVALVGVVVAAALALLPQCRMRARLFRIWTLVPVWFFVLAAALMIYRYGAAPSGLLFFVPFIALSLPPWLALTLFPFHLITKMRDQTRAS